MPRYLVKPDPDEDFYVDWSEIVDAPCDWGTKAELLNADNTEERFARADKHGTSMYATQFGGWNDKGFIYEQIGWLPRKNLKALCLWLQDHGEEADVMHLLEPLDG